MSELPESVAAFLGGKRFAVAGVSREAKGHVGNAIFRKLRDAGYAVVPVNPKANEVEGVPCFAEIPDDTDSVMICTAPDAALALVRQCANKGVKHVWFHRAFGQGSVSGDAVAEAKARGLKVIENGCPMMFVEPVDGGHKFICWWLRLFGKAPK